MAKLKTMSQVEKLREEVKKISREAKEKERVLLAKIKEEEKEIFLQIGERAVDFINGKIDKNELENFVKSVGLFKESEVLGEENV